jgi:hypothetical protein
MVEEILIDSNEKAKAVLEVKMTNRKLEGYYTQRNMHL